jgi:Zn-dependent protease/CBS domain-containing protein
VRSQIKLGRILGIKIGLHYSWFIIAALILLSLTGEFRATHGNWSTGLIVTLASVTSILFFVSLLLHELSHSVVARQWGMPVREITLFALGGVSQIEGEAPSAKAEFWMAAAGPLMSVLLGALCLGGVAVAGGRQAGPWAAVFFWLGYINLALAGFNLLPGYPLDGGRVLRATLWWKTGDMDRATKTAAKVGQGVAAAFIGLGIIGFFGGGGLGALWIAFIGFFLLQAAGQSYLQVSLRRALEKVRVEDVMTHECPTVEANLSLEEFVHEGLLRTGRRCFVVMDNGSVAGLITPHEIREVDRARWPFVTVREAMRSQEELKSVAPETPLSQALEVMTREDLNQLPVVSGGHLEGVLSRAEIINCLETQQELQAK